MLLQEDNLQDSGGVKPTYSLRTLARALEYTKAATPTYGLQRALYDGAAMAFMTQLHLKSAAVVESLLQGHLLRLTKPKELKVSGPFRCLTCAKFENLYPNCTSSPSLQPL